MGKTDIAAKSYLIDMVAIPSGPAVFARGAAPKLFPRLPLEEVPDGGVVLGAAAKGWLWCARSGVGPSVHALQRVCAARALDADGGQGGTAVYPHPYSLRGTICVQHPASCLLPGNVIHT